MTQSQTGRARFKVPDMACSHCRMAIMKALSNVKGVISAEVDLPGKTVVVEYQTGETTLQALMDAIKDAGYTPEVA
mgnify:CR=1 FL=1